MPPLTGWEAIFFRACILAVWAYFFVMDKRRSSTDEVANDKDRESARVFHESIARELARLRDKEGGPAGPVDPPPPGG